MSENSEQQPCDADPNNAGFESVLATYIRACETGAMPDRTLLLAQHPTFAAELKQFFTQRDHLNRMADPIREFGDDLFHAIGPGQQLSYVGNYELLEEVARGGMGVVYKARQKTLGRLVAVKMIVAGRLANEQDVQRFQSEAQAAASLQHPNIVSIHEVGQHEGWHYFSMDFVEGRDLSAILRDNLLPAKTSAGHVRQMAEAIDYAHQQGVLHRDLKPSNILIDSHDQVRITDFGLALRIEDDRGLTQTGQVLGTPSYMPPEQAQGKRALIGPASDVYALGAILYECLTGRPPFRADSVINTIAQVIHAEAASPRSLNSTIPRDLETICLKCLEKEPKLRYGTAQLLADDLGRFLNAEPVFARPIGRPRRVWRWCQKHTAVASLLATLVTCLVVGTMVSTYFAIRESQQLHRLESEQKQSSQLRMSVEDLEHRSRDLNLSLAAGDEKLHSREVRLYQTNMQLARSAWRTDNIELAKYYLNESPATFRDLAWNTLRDRCYPQFVAFDGQRCVAFSADGKLMAAASGNLVKFWNPSTHELVRTLEMKTDTIKTLDLNKDGTLLACSSGNQVFLWDVKKQVLLHQLAEHQFPITDTVFSPDGNRLATASRNNDYPAPHGMVIVWDLPNCTVATKLPGIEHVAFSHDSCMIASRNSNSKSPWIGVWDLTSTESPAFVMDLYLDRYLRHPWGLAFHPVKDELAVSTLGKVSFRDLSLRTLHRLSAAIEEFEANRVVYSPDGNRFALAGVTPSFNGRPGSFRVIIFNGITREQERILSSFTSPVSDIAFSPDGNCLATADDSSVKLWDVKPTTDPTAAILNDIVELKVGQFDWPQWGGSRARINTPSGKNIPTHWDVGDNSWIEKSFAEFNQKLGHKPKGSKNIKWAVKLGTEAYGNPVVANGRIFLGTNNGAAYLDRYPAKIDLGVLLCFEEETGNFLWQHSNEKLPTGRVHDWPNQGVCSTPVVDGDRLWYVSNRGEVVCLDTEGFYDGEDDGPILQDGAVLVEDADVVWRFDMMKELGVRQHNMANCSMLTLDGMLFVCTSNGVDDSHMTISAPDAPSFVALDRLTGKVIWTDNSPGKNILHAQWASPSYGVFNGIPQVIFPSGDGWLYSFDPKGDGKGGSKLLWKFDGNLKTSIYRLHGATRGHFIAFPAIYDGLVYIATGEDPEHGEGPGSLWCIDPLLKIDGSDVSSELAVDLNGTVISPKRIQAVDLSLGERAIPNPDSAVVWLYVGSNTTEFEQTFHRSLSTPVIKDDVLYTTDFSGLVHCLNAKTGRAYWTYDLLASCWTSPLLVDGKVYIADEDGDIAIFRHTENPRFAMKSIQTADNRIEFIPLDSVWDGELINQINTGAAIYMTPIVANNVLYIATCNALYAIEEATVPK